MYAANFMRTGPPLPPVGLTAIMSQENSTIVLSWSNFSPSYAPITYNVTIEEDVLTHGDSELLLNRLTTSSSLLYTPPDDFCSVIFFMIQAFNGAGESNKEILHYDGFVGM